MQEVIARRPRHGRDDVGVSDAHDVSEAVSMLPASMPRQRSLPERYVRVAMDKLWSLVFLTVASLGLFEAHFGTDIVHAASARRTFVHLGVLWGTLVGVFGGYIEVYRNVVLGEHVRYESVKTATHGMLASMLLSGLCLTIGMWPVWHWLTLPYLMMWSWGVVVQLLVILPPVLQRVVFVGAYCWFMYSYLSAYLL
ncbi:unnamed protein product [Hyaloperonospora brassicae]|uniref:Transmembrane protein 107 n=1 Tax=Hyaloperonospora brassicae TaxID=162125 RepID=A0AAV0TDT8_HYABA|nr:unnamed protein product [Hyaloperonospora brassicae]